MARSAEVDAYMNALEHPMAEQVERLRSAILNIDSRINEHIKWNAPSFYIDDHFATFNLHYPDRVQIVLHVGAKVNPDAKQLAISDHEGLLQWAAVDRASVTFRTVTEVDQRFDAFLDLLKQWITLVS